MQLHATCCDGANFYTISGFPQSLTIDPSQLNVVYHRQPSASSEGSFVVNGGQLEFRFTGSARSVIDAMCDTLENYFSPDEVMYHIGYDSYIRSVGNDHHWCDGSMIYYPDGTSYHC